MKKVIILVFMLIAISCDKFGYDDFVIINNCNEEIAVSIVRFNHENDTLKFTVEAKSEYLFHSSKGVPAKVPDIVDLEFKQIIVKKDGKISQKNYVGKTKWIYVDVDDTHSEWHLHVNPEDFE